MMSNFTLGIDPGLKGALSFVKDSYMFDGKMKQEVHAFDMPVVEYKLKGKKTRREINIVRLAKILQKYPIDHCFLELLWGMPGMSGTAMFTFGQAYGALKATLTLCGIPYEQITPQAWKKHYNLPKDKDAAIAKATEIFPDHRDLWARKKDDGRAEATLIAKYGLDVQVDLLTNERTEQNVN